MNIALQRGLNWWNVWQGQSANRRIFAAMLTVGGFTVLVKLTAVVKDVIVAYQFGADDVLDTFLIAMVLPQFAITLIAGSFNAALIPAYIQVREQEGQNAAQCVLSSIMVVSVGLLVALSVVLAISAPYILPLVASGFSAEKLALTQSLYYVVLSTLVLNGLATTWGGILNVENRFAFVAVVPMATSIITALLVVVMAQEWGGYTLAVGVVGGALVETGLIGWRLTRQGISLIPRWCGMFPAVKSVLAQYAPSVAAAFLMGSITVVSQSMAATLPPGTVAVLSYGNKLTNLILGIGATAVSMAVLPHFSRMVTATDWQELRHTLSTYTRLLLIILIPLTTVLIYFSEPLMAMFFQRGAFTEADTHLAGQVQVFCLLQIPVYIVGRLFVGLISALKTNQLMMWGNIINLCVCIVLNYALMQWLGVLGLALAASLLYAVSCCFLSFVSLRLINRLISSIGMSAGVILGGKA